LLKSLAPFSTPREPFHRWPFEGIHRVKNPPHDKGRRLALAERESMGNPNLRGHRAPLGFPNQTIATTIDCLRVPAAIGWILPASRGTKDEHKIWRFLDQMAAPVIEHSAILEGPQGPAIRRNLSSLALDDIVS